MIAFGGDARTKSRLTATIDRHLADDTLVVGALSSAGETGSPLGVSVVSGDPADYAATYGYPVALAALLDPLASAIGATAAGRAFVRDWVAVVTPGADLSAVPIRLLLLMLEAPEFGGDDDGLLRSLIELHHRTLAGETHARSVWLPLREWSLRAADAAQDRPARARAAMAEAVCWPVPNARSVLSDAARIWLRLAGLEHDPTWNEADLRRADTVFRGLWEEQVVKGRDPEEANYPALFAARDPDLAARYSANLSRGNARLPLRAIELGEMCLALMKEAPVGSGAENRRDAVTTGVEG